MATGINWASVAERVASYIYNLHQWNDYQTVEICGRSCNVEIKGRFHKWNKWVWDGRCECGGIIGSTRHYNSRNGAAQNAIKDFIVKAGQAGLIAPEQVQQYK